MGTSAVVYRESMFWTNDHFLQVWLALLAREVQSSGEPSGCLVGVSDQWCIMACHEFTGCVNHSIPEDLAPAELNEVVSTCDAVLTSFDRDDMTEVGLVLGCSNFDAPSWSQLRTRMTHAQIHDIGTAFVALLTEGFSDASPGAAWFVGSLGGRYEFPLRGQAETNGAREEN